ncbi:MAG: hypothetical protein Q9227_002755 [Pyrenula ochraceoflavens]
MYQFGSSSQAGGSQNHWLQQQSPGQYGASTAQYQGYQQSTPTAVQYQASQYYGNQNQQYPQYPQYPSSTQPYQGSYYQYTAQPQNATQAYQGSQNQWYPHNSHTRDASQSGQNTQTNAQTCYNCGNPGHWAQNCPEPRRAVPAGEMNNPPPPKRQKTGGPVITRYPPPPNYNSRGPQRGYTHPPVGQQNYSQSHSYSGMPTPVSANDANSNQWQHHSPAQQSPYPQSAGQTAPWAQASTQTPTSQYSSPMSATMNPYHGSFPTPSGNQYGPEQENQRKSFDSSANQPSYTTQNSESRVLDQSKSQTSDGPFAEVEDLEPWMEELQALDIPENGVGSGSRVSHPPNPVAQPLPSTAEEADAIGRLPIAAKLPPGMPISRYFQNKSAEECEESIRKDTIWHDIQNDPGFIEFHDDDHAVSMVDLKSQRKAIMGEMNDESELAVDEQRYHSHEDLYLRGSRTPPQRYDKQCEPYGEDVEATVKGVSPQAASTSLNHLSLAQPTRSSEPPNPDPQSKISPPDTAVQNEEPVPLVSHTEQSWSPERTEGTGSRNTNGVKTSLKREQSREIHVYTEAQEALQGFANDGADDPPTDSPSQDENRNSEPKGIGNGEDTNGHIDMNDHDKSDEQTPRMNSKEQSSSPLRSRQNTADLKKRPRHTSEESDGGAKRQLDDGSTRVKRRQPRVAEAYGYGPFCLSLSIF